MDEHRVALVSLVQELIQLRSVNSPPTGDEKLAQQVVGHWLRQLGLTVDEYSVSLVPGITDHPAWRELGRDYSNRPNVMAYLQGSGSGPSLLFTGHMDTVGLCEDEPWQHQPFAGDFDGESIFGLGAFDMKGGLAAGMMAVRCLVELGVRLGGTLYFESVVDEEYGGANATLAGRLRYPQIDGAILMEPTNLRIATGHKNTGVWNLTVRGHAGRSFSGETTSNPAKTLVEMIQWLDNFFTSRVSSASGPEPYLWEIDRLHAGPSVQFMGTRVPPTASVTFWVEGGVDDNPDILDQMATHLNRQFEPSTYELVPVIPPLWGSEIAANHSLVAHVQRSMRLWEGDDALITAPFACDGAMFNRHSQTPVLILGPQGGNAHSADEYVNFESLVTLSKVLACTAVEWCNAI
jgi:acetylornithine deacetylase